MYRKFWVKFIFHFVFFTAPGFLPLVPLRLWQMRSESQRLICTLFLQRATKKKKIHQWKSKQRFEKLEVTQNKRQNAWQQFQTAGSKKKVRKRLFSALTETAGAAFTNVLW
jgi:hypothetical protein